MTINMAVEPLVRQAFSAAVARDSDQSISALAAISAGGDHVTRDSIELATVVCVLAVLGLHEGQSPDTEQIRDLANSFAEMEEEWSGIDANQAQDFFAAISGKGTRQTLPPETYARVLFVAGGWLLSSFGPEDKNWWDSLDELLTLAQQTQS